MKTKLPTPFFLRKSNKLPLTAESSSETFRSSLLLSSELLPWLELESSSSSSSECELEEDDSSPDECISVSEFEEERLRYCLKLSFISASVWLRTWEGGGGNPSGCGEFRGADESRNWMKLSLLVLISVNMFVTGVGENHRTPIFLPILISLFFFRVQVGHSPLFTLPSDLGRFVRVSGNPNLGVFRWSPPFFERFLGVFHRLDVILRLAGCDGNVFSGLGRLCVEKHRVPSTDATRRSRSRGRSFRFHRFFRFWWIAAATNRFCRSLKTESTNFLNVAHLVSLTKIPIPRWQSKEQIWQEVT